MKGQQLNASIVAQTRLTNTEEFGNILLKVNQDGSQVRLRDVAKIELGGENYDVIAKFNGQPASGLGIKLATGANALDTANAIRAELKKMEPFFPSGLKIVYPYDTTPFVQISIHEVVKTLVEAIILVFLVMYLFLQNFRATLIPTIAVPVVLLGTFAILALFGFSINTLTMFGMVLAIGLLVDDAIVVVENVERVMAEEGLPPKEATRKSMGQIQGALVGIAMVLSAVFIPMAFFGGSTGAIYRQFFRPFRHGAYMPRPRGKENGQFILSLYAEAVDGHITGPCVGMAGITHSQGDIWPGVIRRIGGRGHQPGQIESRFFCQVHHFLAGCLFL